MKLDESARLDLLVKQTSEIMTSHRVAIERYQQVVASVLQLLDRDTRRTLYDSVLVKVENGLEDCRGDSIGHRVLAPVVWLVLQSRTEHPAQHGVRVLLEDLWVDNEPRVVHYQSDRVRVEPVGTA